MSKVSNEVIESFLNGGNETEYVVAIEAGYREPYAYLVINPPNEDKKVIQKKFNPFLWVKESVLQDIYEGKKTKRIDAQTKYGVNIKKLKTQNSDGFSPARLESGYTYLVTCTKSYNSLIEFFKVGGIDPFDKLNSKLFFKFQPVEQFMIQSGIRLFKGIDDYSNVHRMQFDLETEGLSGKMHSIFQIGIKDNRGFEYVLETVGENDFQKRESERENIKMFFKIINELKPDIIAGYFSEGFDWPFIIDRCDRLDIDLDSITITLDENYSLNRKPATLKLGNEQEVYDQTYMWGYNIIDIIHSVRRAQAINSDIKESGLKYVTKYSNVAKENRVYVPGDRIYTTWNDRLNKYAFNEQNGDWFKLSDRMKLEDGYVEVGGDFIIRRYLLDDLWETEKIDEIFNQAAFLISKLLPTTYSRGTTMGTASQWKLIMSAWSYENDLAIPETEPKRKFTGGLSRLLQVGYAKNVVKLDYAALYPKTELTHSIFPDLDISGVMEGLLTYIVDTRDKFKFMVEDRKNKIKVIDEKILNEKSEIIIKKLVNEKNSLKAEENIYDKKQLPLKILANSWFGAYGAPYIFNWGDTNCAEETTCRGRQYLRLMVSHFSDKYGFKPLVGDSVTYDTPVYIRYKSQKNYIDVLPICDLFNENSEFIDSDKFRDFEKKPFEVLTRDGWKEIKYVYRHETDKKIHRITTKDRLINVTEDHSLFQNGKEVKPSELKRFDKIDTYEVPKNNVDTGLNINKAYLYGFFLGDGSANCSTRKQKYTSKKTGQINIDKGKRSDWKISNTNLKYLEKLKDIVEREFFVKAEIKNHIKSSGVYNLVVHNVGLANNFCEHFYTSYRKKKIPYMILNASEDIKKAFIEGVFASDGYGDTIDDCSDIGMKSQIAMAGISLLLKELNIEFKIKTRSDKQNFISFSLKNSNRNNSSFTEKTKKKTNEVWKNEIILNKDKNNFVYDISTEDGTFICGINGVIAHNTDGFNFSFPENINEIKYLCKGSHWKTMGKENIELVGLDAVLAEFNENFMSGRMGLDIDEICESTINFARKNYANKIGKKIKFVGNSIKSKKMPVYIEEFLDTGIQLLLNGKGKEFIENYYLYVDKIYNYNIPLVKIASKSRVRSNLSDYKKKATKKNKAGNPMPKQAHMELALMHNLNISLGETIYYVNTGKVKSHGDIKTIKDENGDAKIQLNCKLIPSNIVENNLELCREILSLKRMILNTTDVNKITEYENNILSIESSLMTDEYNVAKYLESFNKKIKPLLICFNSDIRNKILLKITKDKKTKLESLSERNIFTDLQCELVSGIPNNVEDQDTYEELMTMEDKEIMFWDSVGMIPNNMEHDEWIKICSEYKVRYESEFKDGVFNEKETLTEYFKRLEKEDIEDIFNELKLPLNILKIVDVNSEGELISKKWGVKLFIINDIFLYSDIANERYGWYSDSNLLEDDNRYEIWKKSMEDKLIELKSTNITHFDEEQLKELVDSISTIRKKLSIKDDDNDDENEEEDEDIEITDEFNPEYDKIYFEIDRDKVTKMFSEEKDDLDYIDKFMLSIKKTS